MRVTVLGGGNTAFSIAARLALDGNDVLVWEHPTFAHTIDPIKSSGHIELIENGESSAASVVGTTIDPEEALAWSEMLVCSVPSYAHGPFIDMLAPFFRPGHVLVLLPGNLGSLVFAKALRARGIEGIIVAESETAPYVCRKTGPAQATIWGRVPSMGVGVFPESQTSEVLPEIVQLFPGAQAYTSVLDAGLSAMNPVVHPAGVLMNAGRIERSRGAFWFYEEGVTPAVVRTIEAVDRERRAIGAAYGLEHVPVARALHDAGFGPQGDLWSVINGSRMLTALRAPGSLDSRWLTEDVPFGLATWVELAKRVDVETPVTSSLIELASAALGTDFWRERRSLDDLGLAELSHDEFHDYLHSGRNV